MARRKGATRGHGSSAAVDGHEAAAPAPKGLEEAFHIPTSLTEERFSRARRRQLCCNARRQKFGRAQIYWVRFWGLLFKAVPAFNIQLHLLVASATRLPGLPGLFVTGCYLAERGTQKEHSRQKPALGRAVQGTEEDLPLPQQLARKKKKKKQTKAIELGCARRSGYLKTQ